MKKVKLQIKRKSNIGGIIEKTINVETNNDVQAKKEAQLIWLKEYVNRDGIVYSGDDISELKKHAKVTIEAIIVL